MRAVDTYFKPALSSRVHPADWIDKILDLGVVLIVEKKGKLQGLIAFYCNDRESKQAAITLLVVDRSVWRQGIGRRLLGEAINSCRRKRMQSVLVTTEADNATAIMLYETFGFRMDDRETERTGKTTLRLPLGKRSNGATGRRAAYHA